jgi:hypothetical protein
MVHLRTCPPTIGKRKYSKIMTFEQYHLEFLPFLSDEPTVAEPWWGVAETKFRDYNMVWEANHSPEAYQQYSPFIGSWLLARLWFLSAGKIKDALGVDSEGFGAIDGGHYVADAVIKNDAQEIVATLWVEGTSWGFAEMRLVECDVHTNPEMLVQGFSKLLWQNPQEVSVCKIAMRDFERNMHPIYYGYDGENFIANQDEM